jgi:cytochrome c-type biogenesis protein CcmH
VTGAWWVLAFCALAGLALLLPLARLARAAAPAARHDVAVYRAQLAELARDRDAGRLDQPGYDAAVIEIERRLLAAADEREAPAAPALRWPLVVAALAVPALAIAIYLPHGTPDMPDFPLAEMQARRAAEAAEVAQLVATLRTRIAETAPGSPQRFNGLVLLGNTERARGESFAAANAFRAALAISFDATVAVDLAETLALAEDGRIGAEAVGLLARAAPLLPNDPRPDFYLGLAARQNGDPAGALNRWRALAARSPADAPWLAGLRQRISEAEGALAAPGPGPRAEDVAAAQGLPEEARAAMVRGMVDRLRTRLASEPDDGEGWLRLARAERVLGNLGGAMVALTNAERLLPNDARVAQERRALATGTPPPGG